MWRGLSRWLVVLCVLVGSTLALASSYPGLGYRMLHSQYSPFRYYVDDRQARPADIALSEVQKAIQGAYQAWAGVTCAHPAFSSSGVTSSLSLTNVNDTRDRYNVTPVFITDKNDPAYAEVLGGGGLNIRPMASVPLTYGGYVFQCDIFINATGDFRWSTFTPTQAGFLDLQSHLTREVGRCMGLGNADQADAVMSISLPEGVMRRALTQHDIDHVCTVYPQDGQVGTPCSATNTCSGGLTCVSAPEANGLPGYKVCTKGCTNTTAGECPLPLVCKASTAVSGSQYACLPNMADYVTRVGNACTDEAVCNSPWGACLKPVTLPSSTTVWSGGYCTQQCNTGSGLTCPAGSSCVGMEIGPKCLKNCRLGGTDCRAGYICLARQEGTGTVNVCVPACNSDPDCGNGYACRLCDNTCVPRQKPGASIGDTCNVDTDCGTYQKCLKPNGHPQGICSQACDYGTCSCPDGSTCQKVGSSGASMCVRTCSQSTCASGQQCAPFSGGATGCLPPCRTSVDCPSGSTCNGSGQCVSGTGSADAGCPLCGGGDAGTPPIPPAPDAGTGSEGPAGPGCGCLGTGVNAPGFLGALALFLVASRRRRCQRP